MPSSPSKREELGLSREGRKSESAPVAGDGPVVRAFGILERLACSHEAMRLSAIARDVGLQRSTVHRMLGLLTGLGYVEQVAETGYYRATLKLWELGQGLIVEHPVKRVAAAFLLDLHRTTQETAALSILDGEEVLFLDKIIAPRPAPFLTRVGSRVPAILTAGGKAMLSLSPDARSIAKRLVATTGREQGLTLKGVLQELEDVRRQGYAVASYAPGVVAVAAPVMGRDGQGAAAISVSAPVQRLNAKKQAKIVECVLTTSAQIAERVGRL
ncbi:MAG: IclR family transcriptional regulator [Myxococcales bacterium]|nr:IclR family transcriptional regulator [Myxococcales bacterium]